MQPPDMKDKDKKGQNKKRRAAGDRLRRLLSLMVRYATRDGQAPPEQDSPSDASDAGEYREGEA